jgi:hypothetical protein
MVLEAIRNETFYVITHEFIYGLIQTRLNSIINKTNPEPSNETGEVMAIVKELMGGRIS